MRLRFPATSRGVALMMLALFGVTPAFGASTQVMTISASVSKPLTMVWVQDLDLGSIASGPGAWSGATVAISRAGTFSCTSASVTCTGATKVAKYQVTGSNNMVVRISAPNVTLVNQADATQTLLLTIDSPGSLILPNSGSPGAVFSLGGAITLSSSTAPGLYSGTLNVTVDY